MRTSEERVEELHNRIRASKQAVKHRRFVLSCAVSFVLCVAVIILFSLGISRILVKAPEITAGSAVASIFADHGVQGYILVALLSLCLGILLTIFCFRLKKHMDEEKDNDRKL